MHALTASLLSLFLMTPLASGWLGVYLSLDSKEAVVSEVIPGTPAQKAGLKSGDVLLAVGDTKTPTREKFTAEIQSKKPGTRIKIQVRRGKRERVVVVKLGERPADVGAGSPVEVVEVETRKPPRPPKPTVSAPVVEVAPRGQDAVASKEKGYLGISVREGDGGLIVDRILEGGPSAKSGLSKGDVLKSIGDHRIRSLDDLDGALQKIHPGRKVPVGVVSKDAKKSLVIKVGRRPGSGRLMINEPVEVLEVVEQPSIGGIVEVVPTETAEAVAIEVVPAEAKSAKPQQGRRIVRPGRRTAAGTAGPAGPRRIVRTARPATPPRPVRAGQPARPARPTVTSKPARPSNPSRGTGVRGADENLQRELRELRQELKELRRLLEQLRRDRR